MKDDVIKKRILEVIEDIGGNSSEMARRIGVSPNHLASVLSSEEKGISATMIKGFADAGISLDWLVAGKNTMYINGEETLESWKIQAENAQIELDAVQDSVIKLEYYIEQLERLNRNQ